MMLEATIKRSLEAEAMEGGAHVVGVEDSDLTDRSTLLLALQLLWVLSFLTFVAL